MIFRTTIYSSSYKFFRLLLVMILFSTASVFAQVSDKDNVKSEEQKISQLSKELEGTWQIQVINSRKMPAIPIQVVETIEQRRLDNDTSYYYLYPDIRIMILPRKVILNKNFNKIEKITHISL